MRLRHLTAALALAAALLLGCTTDSPDVQVRVTAEGAGAFSGAIGGFNGTRSVSGQGFGQYTIPGGGNLPTYTAIFQKGSGGDERLTVTVDCPKGTQEESTTAPYGVAQVNCKV